MSENVAVVGAGSWGTTLAKILGENGHDVLLWARNEDLCGQINTEHENRKYLPGHKLADSVVATTDLQRTCETCQLILFVVPSHGFRPIAHEMGQYINGEHAVVHCTKGIEQDTYKRMSEVLREETPTRKIGVLAGPNLAPELAKKQPAGTLVASRFHQVYKLAQQALHNRYFRVYSSTDVIGAEIGATFKNIVAVAAGVVDGLKMGDNTKAMLMTRGLNEMGHLGAAMGANVFTFGGMAGIGDLVATCSSPLSRNHRVGVGLAQGKTWGQLLEEMQMVAEGVRAAKAVQSFGAKHGLHLPIVSAVYRVLYEDAEVAGEMQRLMTLDAGDEFTGLLQ